MELKSGETLQVVGTLTVDAEPSPLEREYRDLARAVGASDSMPHDVALLLARSLRKQADAERGRANLLASKLGDAKRRRRGLLATLERVYTERRKRNSELKWLRQNFCMARNLLSEIEPLLVAHLHETRRRVEAGAEGDDVISYALDYAVADMQCVELRAIVATGRRK